MPKRIVAVFSVALVLIGLLIVTASPAQDSPASKPPAAALLAVDSAPDLHAHSLKALDRQLGKAAWLADVLRHKTWLADQAKLRQQAAAKAAQEAAQRQQQASSQGSGGGSFNGFSGGTAALHALVLKYFGPLGSGAVATANCVITRESNWNPGAQNPNSSAGGLFQWLSGSWLVASHEAGWSGASRFDPVVAIAVSAYWVVHHGWSAWNGGNYSCGF